MEKIAVQRISEHLTLNGLHEELQSAYKPLHSTETAFDACSARYCKCNGYQPGSTISFTRYVRCIWHHRCKHSHRHTTQSSRSKGHPIDVVPLLPKWQMFRCESRKQSISRSQTEVRCSTGVCTWAFSIHGLFCGYRGDSEETWHQIP